MSPFSVMASSVRVSVFGSSRVFSNGSCVSDAAAAQRRRRKLPGNRQGSFKLPAGLLSVDLPDVRTA